MSKRLEGKASLVVKPGPKLTPQAGNVPALPHSQAPVEQQAGSLTPRERTAPGQMANFLRTQSKAFEEVEDLRAELKSFDGAIPTRTLDPKVIRPSQWANRQEEYFLTEEFLNFKEEIRHAGGNIQPIKVRPVEDTGDGSIYEVAFGHRRHRACLELGLDVVALIEPLTDVQLFENMDRENRQRADLRPYEQGEMYRKAIDENLFPSIRFMAQTLGIGHSNIVAAIQIARLPTEVLDAFPSRLEIQHRWSPVLNAAWLRHGKALITVATQIAENRQIGLSISTSSEVFDSFVQNIAQLEGRVPKQPASTKSRIIVSDGKKAATVKSLGGRYTLTFEKNLMQSQQQVDAFEVMLSNFLKKEGGLP